MFTARARDVGQVSPITIDDQPQPNIYAGASSAYGVQIVAPDSDGDGRPERINVGQPGARFMDGQWGPGGTAGSIYRIDGFTVLDEVAVLPRQARPGDMRDGAFSSRPGSPRQKRRT